MLLASSSALAAPPESFAPLVERLSPAVVNIATTQKVKNPLPHFGMPFEGLPGGQGDQFREFFEQFNRQFGAPGGIETDREVHSLGSGFIIDAAGYVITNNHVIAEADEITVVTHDNVKLPAKIVGRDSKTDIALLKVSPKRPLPFVTLGDSDAVRVGDWVIAIGNPFGLGGTVTAGIISARARNINAGPFDDFLQTDAAINRGNSGGPMFNTAGEVIGIATAIFSPNGGSIGIGFAIPSSLAKPVITQLKAHGKIERGWLGVKIQEVDEEIADSLGLKKPHGALVVDVGEKSPAAKAGLEPGDVILSFDGKAIDEMRKLPRIVAETPVGKKAPLVVWRAGREKTLTILLGEMKEEEAASRETDRAENYGNIPSHTLLGMRLAELTPKLRGQLGLPQNVQGIAVVGVGSGSAAALQGVRPGDVLLQVNDVRITGIKPFAAALKSARVQGRRFVMVKLLRGRNTLLFLTLPVR